MRAITGVGARVQMVAPDMGRAVLATDSDGDSSASIRNHGMPKLTGSARGRGQIAGRARNDPPAGPFNAGLVKTRRCAPNAVRARVYRAGLPGFLHVFLNANVTGWMASGFFEI